MGLPFFYAVRGMKTIFFGSLDDSYTWMVNCLVIMAWILVAGCVGLLLKHQGLTKQSDMSDALSAVATAGGQTSAVVGAVA